MQERVEVVLDDEAKSDNDNTIGNEIEQDNKNYRSRDTREKTADMFLTRSSETSYPHRL